MTNIETKILKVLKTNKLNPQILGERNWYNYFIRVTELVWRSNIYDGYKIEVYNEKYGIYLITIIV
ncbi:MAG: hypothetical protein ACOVLC_07670 [Flavobacterium sp.]